MPIDLDLIPDDPKRAWVRVTTFEGPPENVERALRLALDRVVPAARERPGWQGTLGLTSPDGRRGLTLSFWESWTALTDSGSSAHAFRLGAAAAGISIADIDAYEIVFHETAAETVE